MVLLSLFAPSVVAAQVTLHSELGASVRNRAGEVALENGEERRYELGAYSELVARIALRPFGGRDTLARGLEARTWFAHSLGLDTESVGNSSGSSFLRFGADIGWLGPATRRTELGVGFGFVFDGYYIGSSTEFPNARYLALRPELRLRQQVREEKLALDFGVAYRAVVFERGITDRFGSDLQIRAFDLTGAVMGQLKAFTWALRLTWVSYLFELDGNATEALATDGHDHSVRMEILVGWKLE